MPVFRFQRKARNEHSRFAERVYAAVNSTDLSESWIIGGLLTLRGLGRRSRKL
jgi:hypothetical protein